MGKFNIKNQTISYIDAYTYKNILQEDRSMINIEDTIFENCIFIFNDSDIEYYITWNGCNLYNCCIIINGHINFLATCTINGMMIIDSNAIIEFDYALLTDNSKLYNRITLYDSYINISNEVPSDIEVVDCNIDPKLYRNETPFYGYKYTNDYLIILEIPKDALVVNTYTNKCRCNKAKVLSILNINGTYSGVQKCESWNISTFIYEVGKYSYPNEFDTDTTVTCTYGIHFFKTILEAYYFYKYIICEFKLYQKDIDAII